MSFRSPEHARDEEGDLYHLMNLMLPWRYPFVDLTIKHCTVASARPRLVAVGGSFASRPMSQLSASGQFSEVNQFFYYKVAKFCYTGGNSRTVSWPVTTLDFEREIFAADCLVLEINEHTAGYPPHVLEFLPDALQHIPRPPYQ